MGLGQYMKKYSYLIQQLVVQQLTMKYRRTVFGFLWSLLNPLLTMSVSAFVFSMVTRIPLENFVIFIFSGLIPWGLFSSLFVNGGSSLLASEGLIKKIYIPRYIFPLTNALAICFDSFLSFICLFIIILAFGQKINAAALFLPISFILLIFFSFGLCLIANILFVYFRDLQQIFTILLQVGYYATPILYPLSMIPEKYHGIFELNPMTHFLQLFRAPLYDGTIPATTTILFCTLMSVTSMIAGLLTFYKYKNHVVFRM